MPESRLQTKFLKALTKLQREKYPDMIVLKLEDSTVAGMPDVAVIAPCKQVFFYELKNGDAGVLSARQEAILRKLDSMGYEWEVIRHAEQIDINCRIIIDKVTWAQEEAREKGCMVTYDDKLCVALGRKLDGKAIEAFANKCTEFKKEGKTSDETSTDIWWDEAACVGKPNGKRN